MKKLPDLDYLHECFDLVGGDLYWRARPRNHFETDRGWTTFNGKNAYKRAGSMGSSGHLTITLNKEKVMASRVIFKMYYKIESLTLYIVHRDGNRNNNHPHNLCLENRGTSLSCWINPKKTRGVSWSNSAKKWVVTVGDPRKPKWREVFDDIEKACVMAGLMREKFYGTYKGVK